jgi:hypothetical protein
MIRTIQLPIADKISSGFKYRGQSNKFHDANQDGHDSSYS